MYILIAIIVGFVAAIPFGPINVYAISQTLKRDFIHGFLVGLTAAILDFIFCMAAITGMYELTSNLSHLLPYIKIFGIFVLLSISIRMMVQAHKFELGKPKQKKIKTAARPVIASLLLYFTNPGLYAFWLAVGGTVTANGLVSTSNSSGLIFALFCSLGTLVWYFLLCHYVTRYHHQFKKSTFKKILFASAITLVLLAFYTAWTLFFP